jgi:hypothetical protein
MAQQQRINAAALLSELLTEGDDTALPAQQQQQKLPTSNGLSRGHGAGSLHASSAAPSHGPDDGTALEDAPVATASPQAAFNAMGGPRRVPQDLESAGEGTRSVRIASELQSLKQRVGTMATLAERTAAVLVR